MCGKSKTPNCEKTKEVLTDQSFNERTWSGGEWYRKLLLERA